MENKYHGALIRLDGNRKEFCISECLKKLKENLSQKDNECLNNCLGNYEKAYKMAINFDLEGKALI